MTPLAARLFRQEDAPDSPPRQFLSKCQFFETSAIVDMAQEMCEADVSAGCDIYSDTAQLPAPLTAVEFRYHGQRLCFLCEQHDREIQFSTFVTLDDTGRVDFRFASGFTMGTGQNSMITWANFEGEGGEVGAVNSMTPDDLRHKTVRGFNILLEKMLCIINQPGLVDRREKATDKRVARESEKAGLPAAPYWYECRIRQGLHAGKADADDVGAPKALHYVRKHFKPSLARWIEGYWRGDVALGLHLKWYSPQPPRTAP